MYGHHSLRPRRVELGEKDFHKQLAHIGEQQAQALFLPNSDADVVIQASQARQLGLEAVFLGSDSWTDEILAHRSLS